MTPILVPLFIDQLRCHVLSHVCLFVCAPMSLANLHAST